MKMCLQQWIRPTGPKIEVEGVGDCETCTLHEDNKHCRLYYPITISTYEVEEKIV
jgi:hypothetical protein